MRDYAELVNDLRKMQSTEYCAIASATDFPAIWIVRDAADAIEELLARDVVPTDFHERCLQLEIRKRIELEKRMPKWISVEERLPEVAEKVLTYNGNFVSENWLCTVASKVGRINVWAYSEGFVTHWMPLPEPPKEETE
jgi:hypothetical protein